MAKIIGYIRVSTIDQDPDRRKADVLKSPKDRDFSDQVEFVTEQISGAKS